MSFITNTITKAGSFATLFVGAMAAEHFGSSFGEASTEMAHIGGPLLIVLSHLLTHVGSEYIAPLGEEIKEGLQHKSPGQLNHDIQRALLHSMESAVKGLKILYKEQFPDKPLNRKANKFIRKFNKDFLSDFSPESGFTMQDNELKQIIYITNTPSDKDYLYKNNGENVITKKLKERLEVEFKNQIISIELKDLFLDKFLPLTQLYFGESFKKDNNGAMRRAMERMLAEETLIGINKLIQQQEKMQSDIDNQAHFTKTSKLSNKKLAELKSLFKEWKQPGKLEVQFGDALDKRFEDLSEQFREISDDIKRVHTDLLSIRGILSTNGRIAAGIVIFSLISATIVIVRNNMASFNATIVLVRDTTISIPKDYPDLQPSSRLFIMLDKDRSEEITSEKQATFINIDNEYLDETVPVKFEDKLWKSSINNMSLKKGINYVPVRPNDSWGHLEGDIKYFDGRIIDTCAEIHLGSDTLFYSSQKGLFSIDLPIKMRKEMHEMSVYVKGKPFATEKVYPIGFIKIRP